MREENRSSLTGGTREKGSRDKINFCFCDSDKNDLGEKGFILRIVPGHSPSGRDVKAGTRLLLSWLPSL